MGEGGRARMAPVWRARASSCACASRSLSLVCVCACGCVDLCVCVCVDVGEESLGRVAAGRRSGRGRQRAPCVQQARAVPGEPVRRGRRGERERERLRERRGRVCALGGGQPLPSALVVGATRRRWRAVECRVRECLARPADGRDAIEQQVIGVRSADSRRAQQRSARERGRESASQQSERQATQGAERQVQCFLLWRADSETGACAPRGITGEHRATAARERSRPCRLLSLPFFLREREKERVSQGLESVHTHCD
jgi:hypothetical protein